MLQCSAREMSKLKGTEVVNRDFVDNTYRQQGVDEVRKKLYSIYRQGH